MEKTKKSGLSTAGLVLGIVGLCTSIIPIINNLSFVMGILAFIFGIISLVKGAGKGKNISAIILGILAIVITINMQKAVSDVFSDNNSSKTTLTSSTIDNKETKNETSTKTKYAVGEIYEDSNIAIKYVSVDDNYTGYSKYATVKSGHKVIKAEFEFENVSSSEQYVSSYEFDCYADGYDCDAFWSVDDSTFSANLSSGKKAKGTVYFEVPKDAEEITLEYELNVWTNRKVEFVVK